MAAAIVYHNEEFELAGLLCACGCGHPITLLVPDSHKVWNEDGYATVSPSIGVMDAPCKSHFFIRRGSVEMLPAFTAAHASAIMQAQVARHVARDAKPAPWWTRAKVAILGRLSQMWHFFSR
ncbi:DUF6527 family protein [Devosia salina]|uniref:Uncharacterized protein n=1 Tax=Devosia salina TaxID=2860336 RepID=A0ABX8WHG4_9HYPH|nr:hypothetical protein K1X15_00580 [Devosia salina]